MQPWLMRETGVSTWHSPMALPMALVCGVCTGQYGLAWLPCNLASNQEIPVSHSRKDEVSAQCPQRHEISRPILLAHVGEKAKKTQPRKHVGMHVGILLGQVTTGAVAFSRNTKFVEHGAEKERYSIYIQLKRFSLHSKVVATVLILIFYRMSTMVFRHTRVGR